MLFLLGLNERGSMNTIKILELIIILIPWGSMEPVESKAEVEAQEIRVNGKVQHDDLRGES